MDPISPWISLLGLIFGMGERQQASGEAAAARQLGERQMNLVEPYVKRQFERRERIFEPVEEEATERLAGRMRSSPWYAREWLGQSRGLRKPLSVTY